jgi:glycosyltransferase involved in cell wall biosynthesis
VSIGVPVHNGEATLTAALDSLLAQRFGDFELLISDNASTDDTESLCRAYARRDERVRYHRQPVNRGATANFQAVLDMARGEFFHWAAADDMWAPDFLERTVAQLRAHPDFVASITPARKGEVSDPAVVGCYPILDERFGDRVAAFMRSPGSNLRFYSLYRTSALRRTRITDYEFPAGDWAFVVELLRAGKFGVTAGAEGFRAGRGGATADPVRLHDGVRSSALELWMPFLVLNRRVLKAVGWRGDVLRSLALWNLRFLWHYWSHRVAGCIGYLRNAPGSVQ